MKEIEIFAPGTIANISCGFDVLGCCLDSIGDVMRVKATDKSGIRIKKIIGEDLPTDPKLNVAGAAIEALLDALETRPELGFELEIEKKIKPGSGIGSSAASAAGAVFAVNELLNRPFTKMELVRFAAEGERLACGAPIADNVAPALLGGFSLVRRADPIEVLQLPSIEGLIATVVHPQIEIKTSASRAILPKKVALKDAIGQWANVGSLVHALHSNDPVLFGLSLEDKIVEPHRSKLIPGFKKVKKAAAKARALGCGISGSGPSIFAFSKDQEVADIMSLEFKSIFDKLEIPSLIYSGQINLQGIKILSAR